MKKERLLELAGVAPEEECLEEGQIWNMIKGLGSITLILRKSIKKAKALSKDIDPNDPDKEKKGMEILDTVTKYVEEEINKLDIDDDLKKTTIDSYHQGKKEELEKLKVPKSITESQELHGQKQQKEFKKEIPKVEEVLKKHNNILTGKEKKVLNSYLKFISNHGGGTISNSIADEAKTIIKYLSRV